MGGNEKKFVLYYSIGIDKYKIIGRLRSVQYTMGVKGIFIERKVSRIYKKIF